MKGLRTLGEHLINEAYLKGGATTTLSGRRVTKGFVVGSNTLWSGKAPEQADISKINSAIESLRPPYIGSWLDKETGIYYVDAVELYESKEVALEVAHANKEIAIYDLETMKEIRL